MIPEFLFRQQTPTIKVEMNLVCLCAPSLVLFPPPASLSLPCYEFQTRSTPLYCGLATVAYRARRGCAYIKVLVIPRQTSEIIVMVRENLLLVTFPRLYLAKFGAVRRFLWT